MNPRWKTFLETHSASFANHGASHFSESRPVADCWLCDLSHLGLIAVGGEDAATFLQGQLTNDIRELSDRHSHLSGFCSPKGRMLANFRVFRHKDRIYLQLPAENLEPVLKRLAMFVLRSRVTVENASEQLVAVGISGDCAGGLLSRTFQEVPSSDGAVAHAGDLTLIRIPAPSGSSRFEILGPVEAMEPVWQSLALSATVVAPQYWSLADVRAGLPTVYPETVEAFVPQMTNMQLVDGVSFTKGCYTGQEVVARMQYLGKLKRRMYLAHVDTDRSPQPGDELYSPATASGQGTGRVVDAQPAPAGGYDLLAVIERSCAEEGDVYLAEDGPKLVFLDLPYELPNE